MRDLTSGIEDSMFPGRDEMARFGSISWELARPGSASGVDLSRTLAATGSLETEVISFHLPIFMG
jgi:hypothetical protein